MIEEVRSIKTRGLYSSFIEHKPKTLAKTFYTCAECDQIPVFNIKTKTFQCSNNHLKNLNELTAKLLYEKMANTSKIETNCSKCANKAVIFCDVEQLYLCKQCSITHDKTHKIKNIDKLYSHCIIHNKPYKLYCFEHEVNYCFDCINEHIKCQKKENIIKINEEDVKRLLKIIKKDKTLLNDRLKEIIKELNLYIEGLNNIYSLYETIINTFLNINSNYYVIQNVKELLDNYTNDKIAFKMYEKINSKFSQIMKIIDNSITIKLDIKDTKENMYYLCDKTNNKENINFYLLNKNNCEVLIDGENTELKKYHKFNKPGLHTVQLLLKEKITSMEYMFYNCKNITNIDLNNLNASLITNIHSAFEKCAELDKIAGLNKLFSYGKIKNISCLFSNCSKMKYLDISNLNTKNITNMKGLFNKCDNLVAINGLEKLNTTNAKDMSYMFSGCSKLKEIDISTFNTINLSNMSCMFKDCTELLEINGLPNIKTDNIQDISGLFENCQKLQKINLTNFSTNNVTNMKNLFKNCLNLYEIVGLNDFITTKVTDMSNMFSFCPKLKTLDLSSFNTYKVENMFSMFRACSELTEIIGLNNFKTFNCTNMNYMMKDCFNLKFCDLSKFNFKKVQSIDAIFYGCYNLENIYLNAAFNKVCFTANMFGGEYKNKINVIVLGGDKEKKLLIPKDFNIFIN